MSYDKKFVTPSFRDALSNVLTGKEIEVLDESSDENYERQKRKLGEKVANEKRERRKERAENQDKKYGRMRPGFGKVVQKNSYEPEEDLEELTEEQIFDFLEEEVGPHVEFLLDEGFSEEEIENIIIEMLEDGTLYETDKYPTPDHVHKAVKAGDLDPEDAKEELKKFLPSKKKK